MIVIELRYSVSKELDREPRISNTSRLERLGNACYMGNNRCHTKKLNEVFRWALAEVW